MLAILHLLEFLHSAPMQRVNVLRGFQNPKLLNPLQTLFEETFGNSTACVFYSKYFAILSKKPENSKLTTSNNAANA
jgi:hypothetical protein